MAKFNPAGAQRVDFNALFTAWKNGSIVFDSDLNGAMGVISAQMAVIAGTLTPLKNEVHDARGGYENLDARLDAMASGGGGTTDYTDLTNKPQINSVTLTGNKSLADLGISSASDLTAEATARQAADSKQNDIISYLLNGQPKNLSHFMHSGGTFYRITFTPDLDTGLLHIQTSGSSSGYKGFRILGTSADSVGYEYGIPIPRGVYKLTGLPAGASSSTFRYLLGIALSENDDRTSTSVYADTEFAIDTDTARIDLSAYVAQNANISNGVTLAPMIVRKDLYQISPSFTPWHPPLSDMWNAIRALQSA